MKNNLDIGDFEGARMRDCNGVTGKRVARRGRLTGFFARIATIGFAAGTALTATLLVATGAQAQCTGSGGLAPVLAPFAPLGSGSSINALTSAINAANTVFLTQSSAFISAPANPLPGQTAGGVWGRSIGGEQTTKSTATSTNLSVFSVPVPGTISCRTTTELTFGGVQIGTDIATLNLQGWNLHAGSTLGYLGATAKDTTAAGPLNPLGGTLNDALQIPFAGIYGAATKGNFFLEGQARWLYLQNNLNDAPNGVFNQGLDARGFAINGDVGYHYALQNNWFIEPSAGFIWSETWVDPLNTAGSLVLGTGTTLPGTINIGTIYNSIGRASLRVGTTIVNGNLILQPFGTASFFREFQGNPSATIGSYLLPISATVTTTGVGNYGQFGLGVAGQIRDTGWLGYFRGDYRTGDNIQGWSLNAGLRYQFSPEARKPLIVKGPEPEPIAPYNWTGFRIGAMAGVDWGYTNWTSPFFANPVSPRFAGVLPGGMIGYDYQIGKWVFGAGADAGWTNLNGSTACPNGLFFTCVNQGDWLATATGRIGYTFWNDRVLTYGKAGFAVGEFTMKYTCNTDSMLAIAGCPQGSTSRVAPGWTVGGGTEFALTKNWTVRAETSYFNLGKSGSTLVQGATAYPINVSRQGYIATIGVAYRFDFGAPPAPVVAKY